MLTTYYVTENEALLIGVRPVEYDDDRDPGYMLCEAVVNTCGGGARFAIRQLQAPIGWSTERLARHALDFAQGIPCGCGDPECDGEASSIFPGDPHTVRLLGPYLNESHAMAASMIEAGHPVPQEVKDAFNFDREGSDG
jgi:hypothetical protein